MKSKTLSVYFGVAAVALASVLTLGCADTTGTTGQVANQSQMAGSDTSLYGEEWVVEDIAGQGVIDMSHASIQFLEDGRLAGSATCNRMLGRFEVSGRDLSIGQVGTTMMACPDALMYQERKLLDLLPTVTRYRIDASNALILLTKDGTRITARRR